LTTVSSSSDDDSAIQQPIVSETSRRIRIITAYHHQTSLSKLMMLLLALLTRGGDPKLHPKQEATTKGRHKRTHITLTQEARESAQQNTHIPMEYVLHVSLVVLTLHRRSLKRAEPRNSESMRHTAGQNARNRHPKVRTMVTLA
jgi:hypothetical protein